MLLFEMKFANPSSSDRTFPGTRIEGRDRCKVMTLATDEFIRRFLIHVLPRGFHRIRHYGLFAKNSCAITPHVPASCLPRRPQQRASRCRRQSQRTSLSVLQRSHDHHRGLGARRDASPSTNRSHDRGLDRHVVTAPKPLRKFVSLASLVAGRSRQRMLKCPTVIPISHATGPRFPHTHQPHRRRRPR